MGGTSTTSQNQSQEQNGQTTQNQTQFQNGSTGQQQSGQTNPWTASMPSLNALFGQLNPMIGSSGLSSTENGALNSLSANAAQGNPYAGQIGSYANSLLNGGGATAQSGNLQGGLSTYQNQLTPYANGSMIGNNPALSAQLGQIQTDVTNSANSAAAAAGRDFSGANAMAIGRGVAAGQAPVIANQYNQDVSNQMGAASALYGAQGQTSGQLSGMQQNYLNNQGQGVQAAGQAIDANNWGANQQLAIEAQRAGIPMQRLGMLAQIGIPLAGLGSSSSGSAYGTNSLNGGATANGTTHGTMFGQSNGSSTMSGAQQFGTIASGISSLLGNFGTGRAFGSIY